MKFEWPRKPARLATLVLTIPMFAWLGLVYLVPKAWTIGCFTRQLSRASGRSVQLGGVSGCLTGGLELRNLEIGSPQSTSDPWFSAESIRVDVGLWQVLRGRLEPTHIAVEHGRLRVLRRADGSLELADILVSDQNKPHSSTDSEEKPPLTIELANCELVVVDEVTKTRMKILHVSGSGVREGRRITLNELHGTLNGGPLVMACQLDRSAPVPLAELRLRAEDVVVDDGLSILRYVAPVLSGARLHLKGRLHADLYLAARARDRQSFLKSLEGHGKLELNPIDLDGADLISELARLGEVPGQGRVASIHSEFIVKDQRITTERATVSVGRIPLVLTGSTRLDGALDYRVRMDGLDERLSSRARRLLDDLRLDLGDFTSLNLKGTVDHMVVEAGGISIQDANKKPALAPADEDKLRRLGQRLRDRLLR